MSKKTIGILGCGWLGHDLALKLKSQNFKVRGTSRNQEKLQKLQENEIKAFEIDITEDKIYGDLQGFLEHLDTIVIDIPPGLRKNPESDFAYRMRMLMRFVQVYEIPHVIFISSTSVFEDREDIPTYDEHSIPNTTSNSGKKIIAAEEGIQKMAQKSTIIRPCGLIGSDRHPIKMLAGKSGIKNPDAPVNLVTRDHVNSLIIKVIAGELNTPVIHAISEPHLGREVYYQKAAEKFGLAKPVFKNEGRSVGKQIISMISIP